MCAAAGRSHLEEGGRYGKVTVGQFINKPYLFPSFMHANTVMPTMSVTPVQPMRPGIG